MNLFLILFGKIWNGVFVCILVLSVAACGVKSSPLEFDNQAVAKDREAPKHTTEPQSPHGFPLEYPNRPTY